MSDHQSSSLEKRGIQDSLGVSDVSRAKRIRFADNIDEIDPDKGSMMNHIRVNDAHESDDFVITDSFVEFGSDSEPVLADDETTPMEPFNMNKEREEGRIEDGFFVYDKEKAELHVDEWLKSSSSKFNAKDAINIQKIYERRAIAEKNVKNVDPVLSLKRIIQILPLDDDTSIKTLNKLRSPPVTTPSEKDNEFHNFTLRRPTKSERKMLSKDKTGSHEGREQSLETKIETDEDRKKRLSLFDELTELCDSLMATFLPAIYEMKKSELQIELDRKTNFILKKRVAALRKKLNIPSHENSFWLYKFEPFNPNNGEFSDGIPSTTSCTVYGPFSDEQMFLWEPMFLTHSQDVKIIRAVVSNVFPHTHEEQHTTLTLNINEIPKNAWNGADWNSYSASSLGLIPSDFNFYTGANSTLNRGDVDEDKLEQELKQEEDEREWDYWMRHKDSLSKEEKQKFKVSEQDVLRRLEEQDREGGDLRGDLSKTASKNKFLRGKTGFVQ